MSDPASPASALGYSLGTALANSALLLLGLAVVALVVFLVFREFWTWYWKQSEQVRLLTAIETHLEALEARARGAQPRAERSASGTPRTAPDGRPLTFRERLG